MTSVQRAEPPARLSAPPSAAKAGSPPATEASRGDAAGEASAFELPSGPPETAQGVAEGQAAAAVPGAVASGASPVPTDPALAAVMAALTSSTSGPAAGVAPAVSAEPEAEEESEGGEASEQVVEFAGEIVEIPAPEQAAAAGIAEASEEKTVSPPNPATIETPTGGDSAAEAGPRASPHRPDHPVFGDLPSHPGQGLALGRPEHTPHQGVGQTPGEAARDPRLEHVVGDKANPEAKLAERATEASTAPPAAPPSASPSFESLLKAGPELGAPAQRAEPSSAAASSARGPEPEAEGGNAVPLVPKVSLGTVPIEIGLRSLAGVNRFDIRLDPEDLGGIEVRLDIAAGGEVTARLVVERPETLALLQRDARSLERAFEQAGLKPSEGGLDFSLRDPGSQGGRQDREAERGAGRGGPGRPDGPAQGLEQVPSPAPKRLWRGAAGVDLRI